jgi:hypothetical protein
MSNNDLEIAFSKRLHVMGITPDTKGYRYLLDAVLLQCASNDLTPYMKVILITLAKKYGTEPKRVDSAMCRAIAKTGKRMNNRRFIMRFVEEARLGCELE